MAGRPTGTLIYSRRGQFPVISGNQGRRRGSVHAYQARDHNSAEDVCAKSRPIRGHQDPGLGHLQPPCLLFR